MHDVITADEFEKELDLDNYTDDYQEFRDNEGVPVHKGLYVEDVRTIETGEWDRTGQRGALINLYGSEGVNDLQLQEITPGGETKTLQHLHDQIVYVPKGQGLTVIGKGDEEMVFEWGEHSLFFIPPNTPYRHVNTTDDTPARLVADTPLPLLLTMFKDPELIFDGTGSWWKYYQENKYYTSDPQIVRDDFEAKGTISWIANFVPNIRQFEEMEANPQRGAGGTSVMFPMPDASMWAHISEMPVGRYKKCHRHHPGANIGILSGKGYSTLRREKEDPRILLEWEPGMMFTPPARWWHQHFNTSGEPARYFAMHNPKLGTLDQNYVFDVTHPDNQIEYTEETTWARKHFESELREKGIESKMPDRAFTDPNYEF